MNRPIIGFAGMTHLGIVSSLSAASKLFDLVCYDSDEKNIANLRAGVLPVSEPQLMELYLKNKNRIFYTSDINNLQQCDIVYVAPDVMTDDEGKSDLSVISSLLSNVLDVTHASTTIVVLSQVPPGFTRSMQRAERLLFYQVETLVFGRAVERASFPERYIIGCDDPVKSLPKNYEIFLNAYGCPIMPMRFESAELAKISINMCLVSTVSTTNTIAELCEKIGADWYEIAPALRLDKRIGPHAYLMPGLGISGGNLERDLATFCGLAKSYGTDDGVVNSWIKNSGHRKSWAPRLIQNYFKHKKNSTVIAIWGLAYKENTHSTKNSPSIAAILELKNFAIRVFDPVVSLSRDWHPNAQFCESALEALEGADALMIMTPWAEFKDYCPAKIASSMKGRLVVDPYGLLDYWAAIKNGLDIHTLGRPDHTNLLT